LKTNQAQNVAYFNKLRSLVVKRAGNFSQFLASAAATGVCHAGSMAESGVFQATAAVIWDIKITGGADRISDRTLDRFDNRSGEINLATAEGNPAEHKDDGKETR